MAIEKKKLDELELAARRAISAELSGHREYISNLAKYTAAAAFGILALLASALTFWYGNKLDALEESMLGDAKSSFEQQIAQSTGAFESDVQKSIREAIAGLELNQLVDREFDETTRASIVRRIVEDPEYVETFRQDLDRLIPVGVVLPFDARQCPVGWEPYRPAFGRVVRGIDLDGKLDPDGVREPGSLQADLFSAHSHEVVPLAFVHRTHGGPPQEDMDPGNWGGYMQLRTNAVGGTETRSKNVALLYCKRQ